MLGYLNGPPNNNLYSVVQPTFQFDRRTIAVGVHERPEQIPLKFRQVETNPLMPLPLGLETTAPLPVFLPSGPMPGETAPANMYTVLPPPRNICYSVSRWLCPAFLTNSCEADRLGCGSCCPGARFCKCCDVPVPTSFVPITLSNPLQFEYYYEKEKIVHTKPTLPAYMVNIANTTLGLQTPLVGIGQINVIPGFAMQPNPIAASMAASIAPAIAGGFPVGSVAPVGMIGAAPVLAGSVYGGVPPAQNLAVSLARSFTPSLSHPIAPGIQPHAFV